MHHKVLLILPSLSSGGMERVMTQLAWQFSGTPGVETSLLVMTRNEKFYSLPENVRVYEPSFFHRNYSRLVFTLKILFFVRRHLKSIRPDVVLSFGGKYNAFVLLAAWGLNIKVFISDRSKPGISYGALQDKLNPVLYGKAAGIVAQTQLASEVLYRDSKNPNIRVIGNPVRQIGNKETAKRKIILNVGRFIRSKKQEWLIDYFDKLADPEWTLVFVGEGPEWERVKSYSKTRKSADRIFFMGNVKGVDEQYLQASVFAFTSVSEGFPNVLGEAMSAGCACISFDCEAGPSDLIDDGVNGFLVREGDHDHYVNSLKLLTSDQALCQRLGENARKKIRQFDAHEIARQYLDFLLRTS